MSCFDKTFWAGKKVFITGHTGFKGSWLCLWLESMGADITGYALEPNTHPSLFTLANAGEGIKTVIGDIRDLAHLRSCLNEAQPEIVFHMAAQPIVRQSYKDPVETYAINVMGTVHLLEAVRHCGSVRAVVNVTTDKCYENKEWLWGYRENDSVGGYDPYSNSKACSELVTSAFRHSYFNVADYERHGVAVATARAGNVIGGGDWAEDRLIPDILRAIEKTEPVLIRSPYSVRPWQYVLEPLCGYLKLARKLFEDGPAFSEGWNLGPNHDDVHEVKWIADKIYHLWGVGASYIIDNNTHPHEASYLKLDISKAKSQLGWTPIWDLSKALEELISWHKAYLFGKSVRSACLSSINRYLCDMDAYYNAK